MKKKIVAIVVLMLVATTVVSATNINVKESDNKILNSEPSEPGLFEWWGVDQKQTTQDGYGITLIPPETNAQSFTPTKDKLTAVSLYLFKAGAPPDLVNITVSIRNNLTGSDLVTKTIDTSVVLITQAAWVLFDFDDITITPGNKYYIVCSGDTGSATNAYCWLFTSTDAYSQGEAWHKATAGSSWIKWPSGSTNPADFCFKTYFRKPLDVSSVPQTISSYYQTGLAMMDVSATNINVKEKIQPTSSSVDVPMLKKGDSWTYDYHRTEYRYNGSTLWFTQFLNCTLITTVIDDTGENYTVTLTSKNVEGRIIIGSYRLKYTTLTKISDEQILRKTDLATYHETWQLKGPVFWLIGSIGLPIPAQYQQVVTMSYTPTHVTLPFPFTAGVSGTLPGYSYTFQEKQSLYWGFITLINNPEKPYNNGPLSYQCELVNVTVPAGTYNTYNVSLDFPIGVHGHYSWWQYYVPAVGGNVKYCVYSTTGIGSPVYNIECELVSTTYTP